MSIGPCSRCGALLAVVLALATISIAQQDACSDLVAAYSAAEPNCKLSSSCLQVECSNVKKEKAMLLVSNCKDPVGVQLDLTNSLQRCSRIYGVGGDGHSKEAALDGKLIDVFYSRNASHLQFSAFTASGIAVIPAVDIPLNPHQCMYDSFETASERVRLPAPLTQSCIAESSYCGGILCNFSLPRVNLAREGYETCITIEPCNQTLHIVIKDSVDLNVFDKFFYKNETVVLHSTDFQINLNIILDHYNYSMEATVLMDVPNLLPTVSVLPKQRFILDRTDCSPFISFPAARDTLSTDMMCSGTTPTPNIVRPTEKSLLVVEVVVPVVFLVVSGLVIGLVFLTVGLVYRHYKRKREFMFRRIAFDEIHDDD